MEILKKVFLDKFIENNHFDKNSKIKLNAPLSANYTLEQLIFYIKNRKISHSEYIQECERRSVFPVSIADTKFIIDAVENYQIASSIIEFPVYTNSNDYSYILDLLTKKEIDEDKKNKIFNILLPNSIDSLITTRNIYEFITKGVFIENSLEKKLEAPELFFAKLFDCNVRFIDNCLSFTDSDWKNTICIFTDDKSSQFKKSNVQDLAKLFSSIPTFYVHKKNKFNSQQIKYNTKNIEIDEKNNIVTKYNLINAIKSKINEL
ncbi:hypothetical protein GVAV_002284 [Gurleya vavrai]